MGKLSIIIPHISNTKFLEDTLGSVLQFRPADSEILVVLSRPYGDPYEMNGEDGVRFLDLTDESNHVTALNRAVDEASGEILNLLCEGTEVDEGWAEIAMQRFLDEEIGVVSPQTMDYARRERSMALGVVYRRGGTLAPVRDQHVFEQDVRIAPHVAASFFRKDALKAIGGLDPRLGLRLAGVDASLSITQSGFRVVLEPNCRVFARRGAPESQTMYERTVQAERLFWRWIALDGMAPSLSAHLGKTVREAWRLFPSIKLISQLAGRAAGLANFGAHRELTRRLAAVRESATHETQDAEYRPVSFASYFDAVGEAETDSREAA